MKEQSSSEGKVDGLLAGGQSADVGDPVNSLHGFVTLAVSLSASQSVCATVRRSFKASAPSQPCHGSRGSRVSGITCNIMADVAFIICRDQIQEVQGTSNHTSSAGAWLELPASLNPMHIHWCCPFCADARQQPCCLIPTLVNQGIVSLESSESITFSQHICWASSCLLAAFGGVDAVRKQIAQRALLGGCRL